MLKPQPTTPPHHSRIFLADIIPLFTTYGFCRLCDEHNTNSEKEVFYQEEHALFQHAYSVRTHEVIVVGSAVRLNLLQEEHRHGQQENASIRGAH